MALINSTQLGLFDLTKRLDGSGKLVDIAEIAVKQNDILDDMLFVECNDGSGHKINARMGYPAPTWRELNNGVEFVKSDVQVLRETCGLMGSMVRVDAKAVELAGGGKAASARTAEEKTAVANLFAQEIIGVTQGMSDEAASIIIYGSLAADSKKFTGLAPRYSQLTGESATKQNVLDAVGNAGALNTSIWLVVHGGIGLKGIYPKNTKAGIQHVQVNNGTPVLTDAPNGGQYLAYVDELSWNLGIALENWETCVRIANIDTTKLLTDDAYVKTILKKMVQASEIVSKFRMGKACFYMNRLTRTALRLGYLERSANTITFDSVAGKQAMQFGEIPVRLCESIINTEAKLT